VKKIFISIILFLFPLVFFAQKLSTADKKAINIYRTLMATSYNLTLDDFANQMKKAIKADKTFVEAYWAIADLYAKYPNYTDKAVEILNLALKNGASSPDETHLRLVKIYKNQLKFDLAQRELDKISNDNPSKYTETQQLAEIIKLFKDTVPFEPKNLIYANSNKDEYFPSVTADDRILSVTVSTFGSYSAQEDMAYSKKINGKVFVCG